MSEDEPTKKEKIMVFCMNCVHFDECVTTKPCKGANPL